MPTLKISDGAAHIIVEVLGYEHPAPRTVEDANWLRCEASAKVHGFSGSISASLRVGEFAEFLADLQNCSTGRARSAAFESMEEWLTLRADFSTSGRMQMKCMLAGQSGSMPSLTFRMELEQNAVGDLSKSIAEILRSFPERLTVKTEI